MIINKITLDNYRTHSHKEIEFTEGINLIAGKNGSGKSSILEALGYAMFGVMPRTDLSETVKSGEKSALITVEFTGNDDLQYIAERRLGTKVYHKLFIKGESQPRCEKDTHLKIMELAGLNFNGKEVFENVVSAYQNKFVGIFTETSKNRKIIFDKIFDVSIYELLQDKIRVNLENKYEGELKSLQASLEMLNSIIKNPQELELERNKALIELDNQHKLLAELKTKFNIIKQSIKELTDKKNSIEKAENEIVSLNKHLETDNHNLIESKNDLLIVEKAENDLVKYLPDFDDYKLFSAKAETVRKEISKLETIAAQIEKEKEKLNKIEIERTRSISEISQSESRLIEYDTEIISSNNLLAQLNIDLTKFEMKVKDSSEKLALLQSVDQDQNILYSKILELRNKIERIKIEISNLNESEDENVFKDLLKNAELETVVLSKKQIEKNEISSEIKNIETRIDDNKEAANQLKSGMCPILKEKCKNVEEGSAESFFNDKSKELTEKKAELLNRIELYSELETQISNNQSEKASLKNKIETVAKDKIKLLEKRNELLKYEIENKQFESDFRLKTVEKWNDLFEIDLLTLSIEEVLSETKKLINYANAECSTLSADLKNHSEKISEQKKIAVGLLEKQSNTNSLIDELKTKAAEYFNEAEKLTNSIESGQKQISGLPEFKIEYSQLLAQIENCQEGYDLYNANQVKAAEKNKHEERILRLENEISENIKKKGLLIEEQNQLINEYSDIKLNEYLKAENDTQILIQNESAEAGILTERIENMSKEMQENAKNYNNTLALNEKIEKIRIKKEFSAKIREKLKTMGAFISERMLKEIETAATENYRQISNKTERIHWSSSEKEKYEVRLSRSGKWEDSRSFNMLSGGEQVTAALALRSAMASKLTNTQIAIFDEPTINLDIERRTALAESLSEILKSLRQALVVTHDDSFREMAQNIIEIE